MKIWDIFYVTNGTSGQELFQHILTSLLSNCNIKHIYCIFAEKAESWKLKDTTEE